MGNLEKAGVLVVVALLAVILVVAFLNFPDQNTKTPVLGASVGKVAQAPEMKTPPPNRGENVYPEPRPSNDIIRPTLDKDRSSADAPPPVDITPPIVTPSPKSEDPPPAPPKPDAGKKNGEEKPAPPPPSGYPKTVKVQPGESLWQIAVREYGAKVGPKMLGMITDANPKVRPEALKAGTEISLPAPSPELADAKDAKAKSEPAKKPSSTPATQPPGSAPKSSGRKLPFVPAGN
jgi:nucleoid-associated protein YgaU